MYKKTNFNLPTDWLICAANNANKKIVDRVDTCLYHGDNEEIRYILENLLIVIPKSTE